MLEDADGCLVVLDGADNKDIFEIYETAFAKGIIDSKNAENANALIRRDDFYRLIYRAINVEKTFGGISPSKAKYIDRLKERVESPRTPTEPAIVGRTEFSVEYVINDDLSISWVLPPEYRFLSDEDYLAVWGLTTKDGSDIDGWFVMTSMSDFSDGIDGDRVALALAGEYPQRPDFFRITCKKYNDDYSEKEEWYFNIDISGIDVAIEGERVEPGVFVNFYRQWVPKSMTLKGGRKFRAGAWYFLKSYEHRYRRPEYNSTNEAIFRAREDTDIINNDDHALNLHSGGIKLEDIHIQEVIVGRNLDGGLKLSITPESKEKFTVKEDPEESFPFPDESEYD